MTSSCDKCGGLLLGERVLDYYQVRRWKCVNCGRAREDGRVFLKLARPYKWIKSSAVRSKINRRKGRWI